MRAGFVFLVLAYVLSQFYRAFLAVLAPVLEAELGATASDLALASGLWFAVFAGAQIPVGLALDRLGPRRTSGWLFMLGGAGGAAAFALAGSPLTLILAMALIGLGCAPVLMAGFYIFARSFSSAAFASLAGLLVGLGSAGNLASAAPMAWAAEAFGWRGTLWGLALATLAVGLGLLVSIRDPAPAPAFGPGDAGLRFADVLRLPAAWALIPLLAVNYGPAAGVRGLWAGPYLADVYGLGPDGIGAWTLWMALAMVVGFLAYGPLDRMLGTRKWVILGGNLLAAACLLGLWAFPAHGPARSGLLLAGLGFFGASFPMIIAHGRSYFPPHLAGRGVTFCNLLAIGGAGVLQIASGRIFTAVAARGGPPEAPYAAIFLFFAALMLVGCAVYAFARDRLD